MSEEQTTLAPGSSTHSMRDLLPTIEQAAALPVSAKAAPALPAETASSVEKSSMLNFIALALKDPAIDVEKLRALLSMQKELLADDAEAQFNASMKAAQAEMQPVVRNKENTQTKSKYADLTAVDLAIREIYTRHGFSVSFSEEPDSASGLMEIVSEVSHSPASGGLGHTKRYRLLAPPDTMGPKGSPTKTALHGRASTNTFLRRCLLANVFNLSYRDQDDDGNLGGAAFVAPEQAEEIERLIRETKADRSRFMEHFGVSNMLNMREGDYVPAVNMLNAKLARQKKAPSAEGAAQ